MCSSFPCIKFFWLLQVCEDLVVVYWTYKACTAVVSKAIKWFLWLLIKSCKIKMDNQGHFSITADGNEIVIITIQSHNIKRLRFCNLNHDYNKSFISTVTYIVLQLAHPSLAFFLKHSIFKLYMVQKCTTRFIEWQTVLILIFWSQQKMARHKSLTILIVKQKYHNYHDYWLDYIFTKDCQQMCKLQLCLNVAKLVVISAGYHNIT